MRSFAELAILARLANIAYQVTENDVLQQLVQYKLGGKVNFLGFVGIPSRQALLFKWNGYLVVASRGTQFTEHTNIHEIIDDLAGDPVPLPGMGVIHPGAIDGIHGIIMGIRKMIGVNAIIFVGHSLGAATSCHLPALLPSGIAVEVIAIEPFKCANEEYWKSIYPFDNQRPFVIVNDDSFVPDWPFIHEKDYCLPSKIFLWLKGKEAVIASSRGTTFGESVAAHSIDTICNKIDILAAAELVAIKE